MKLYVLHCMINVLRNEERYMRIKENALIAITRDRKLENSTVSYFMADTDKKIGYVRVTQFVANTGDLFRDRKSVV